jgi:hypothetical protein
MDRQKGEWTAGWIDKRANGLLDGQTKCPMGDRRRRYRLIDKLTDGLMDG